MGVPMTDDELAREFREGRLTRRAFVRQLIDQGVDMPTALARADAIVPAARAVPTDSPAAPHTRPRHADGLEVNFVGDGYVVYDRTRKRMHSLNHTAALVFELCTGANDPDEIAVLLQRAFDLSAPPHDQVRECLESFAKEQLIT